MNRVLPIILVLTLAAPTAATASCLPAPAVEADGTTARVRSGHCGGNMPDTGMCPRDEQDVTCACTICRQGQTDARHALGRLIDATVHPLTVPTAVAGPLEAPADAPTGPPAFGNPLFPLPDLPRLASVVLLI
ncbi:MAG: hypothetical protein ACOC95_00205 [Planctomycetota bacterium]